MRHHDQPEPRRAGSPAPGDSRPERTSGGGQGPGQAGPGQAGPGQAGPRSGDEPGRYERGLADYHDPTAGFAGAPPARSALTLRLVLACFGLVACGFGAAAFVTVVDVPAISGFLAALAAIAVVDIAVVARRKRRGEPG